MLYDGVQVRLAWLEYLSEVIPLMDSGDLRENAGECGMSEGGGVREGGE